MILVLIRILGDGLKLLLLSGPLRNGLKVPEGSTSCSAASVCSLQVPSREGLQLGLQLRGSVPANRPGSGSDPPEHLESQTSEENISRWSGSPEGLGLPLDVLQLLDPAGQLPDASFKLGFAQVHSLRQTLEGGAQLPETQTASHDRQNRRQVPPQWGRGLRVHLLAAGGACDGGDGSEEVGGVLRELLLQSSLLAAVGPGESLVQVEETIEGDGDGDDPPAHGTPHLEGQNFLKGWPATTELPVAVIKPSGTSLDQDG